LTHLASALRLNPKHSSAAQLTVKLLSKDQWCVPRGAALKYSGANDQELKYGQPGEVLLATTWAPDGKIVAVTGDGKLLRADSESKVFQRAQQLDSTSAGLSPLHSGLTAGC
jgi:hypothetical protein